MRCSYYAITECTQNDVLFFVIVGIMMVGLIWTPWRQVWARYNPVAIYRGNRMRKERREYVELDSTYAYVSYVEDQVAAGKYSRDEAVELYRKMKNLFPIRDMFPEQTKLKEAIRARTLVLKQENEGKQPLVVAKGRNIFETP